VIERPVFLHHENDVFDVFDGAGLIVGWNSQGATDTGREGGG
jgi:hypothetical protein